MRGFTQAAALLPFTLSYALVVPNSPSPNTPPSKAVLKYRPREALLKFDVDTLKTTEKYPTFTFQVETTDKACGESHVLLNGLKLVSEWDGTTAHGSDYLDIYGGKQAEWHVSCLFDTVPAGGSNSNGEDIVHVLSLRVGSSVDSFQPGFTVSYKQMNKPAILRFNPRYETVDLLSVPGLANRWRTPSVQFDPEVLENSEKDLPLTPFVSIGQGQKSLGTYLKALKGSIKKGVEKAIEHFCPKHAAKFGGAKGSSPLSLASDRLLEPPPIYQDEVSPTIDTPDSTNTIPSLSAAETRSLTTLNTFDPAASSTSTPSFPSWSDHNLHVLRVFGLVLILSSFFAWVCLRCRDPRRRAECLARREERRNRKLYRRAAREHKVKMWFRNFRLRYGLAPTEAIPWDEKRTRVIEQENVLEDIMTDNIRALRNAHRVVSTITAAEEGRNRFVYDSEGSGLRRSVSTLPGYESEGSQPPNYDDVGGSLEGIIVVDGFQYAPAESEFRSDSSVISTSPRTSRDGTSSDFDEKFEPINLESSVPAGSGP